MPRQSPISAPAMAARACRGGAFWARGLGGANAAMTPDAVWVVERSEPDPIARIETILREHQRAGCRWGVMLGYELGGWVEPRARADRADDTHFPLAVLMRCPPGQREPHAHGRGGAFRLGAVRSLTGREGYTDHVERVRDYIRAGDVYQVNLAHHLEGEFEGDPGACARALLGEAQPRYGAFMRFTHAGIDHSVCSISPELFIRLDASTGLLQSEPMKGTRPIGGDPSELERSPKDRAELNMITDLMRNDIGRVCMPGSVRVRDARKIEPHASGVLQASSLVEGTLRERVGISELIRALFPPGSVTGAPKVRAMQIIDELEARPRRAYCGSMLHIDEQGHIEGSVCIRTAHIWGITDPDGAGLVRAGRFVYPVGAGIVADSDPSGEWEETLVKASVLGRALGVDLTQIG